MKTLNKNLLKQNIEKAATYDFENNKVFGKYEKQQYNLHSFV